VSHQKKPYQVNIFRPRKGQMRDEVLIIFAILLGWGVCTFGFQALVAFSQGSGVGTLLTRLSFFNLPLHFWFTGQFLPLWFIVLCVLFNLYIDRSSENHSRRRDRSYE
jgi:putative solute:sodium symporter small subunit